MRLGIVALAIQALIPALLAAEIEIAARNRRHRRQTGGRRPLQHGDPALFFGKGMGDLPDSMKWLKPFAITGSIGVGFPTQTSAIVDPDTGDVGLVWAGRYFQIGAEAIIPAHSRTGRHVGGVVQHRFVLDDLFSTSIGRPIFH
ncbi:MAG TPA: hypothetical protein VF930_11780 [Stellaceae bacterium]